MQTLCEQRRDNERTGLLSLFAVIALDDAERTRMINYQLLGTFVHSLMNFSSLHNLI